ncbi:hypothetical protein DA2_0221 [Desulfovibrio sp. A2]|nr:hypothetical protein DA2_0221 [Desulfovibrio sp. A2]
MNARMNARRAGTPWGSGPPSFPPASANKRGRPEWSGPDG